MNNDPLEKSKPLQVEIPKFNQDDFRTDNLPRVERRNPLMQTRKMPGAEKPVPETLGAFVLGAEGGERGECGGLEEKDDGMGPNLEDDPTPSGAEDMSTPSTVAEANRRRSMVGGLKGIVPPPPMGGKSGPASVAKDNEIVEPNRTVPSREGLFSDIQRKPVLKPAVPPPPMGGKSGPASAVKDNDIVEPSTTAPSREGLFSGIKRKPTLKPVGAASGANDQPTREGSSADVERKPAARPALRPEPGESGAEQCPALKGLFHDIKNKSALRPTTAKDRDIEDTVFKAIRERSMQPTVDGNEGKARSRAPGARKAPPPPVSLMEQLIRGVELKRVEQPDPEKKRKDSSTGAISGDIVNGMLDVMTKLEQMREKVKHDSDDEDEDKWDPDAED